MQPSKEVTKSQSLLVIARNVVLTTSVSPSEESIFEYQAQRWLWNEQDQLQRRYLRFDVKALIAAAEKAVGPQAHYEELTKLAEGNFNKAILIKMRNKQQVIARLPNPNAGLPHYNTASEVATMDYVRYQPSSILES